MVLEGVERIHWETTSCLCFVGSVGACMRHLGEDVTNDYLMGVSGGAFKMLWEMPWSAANCDLCLIGEEPIQRTFAALGYEYTLIPGYDPNGPGNAKEVCRQAIVASIDNGCPVIAEGVVGPPECCVITGYEQGGEVLCGWSYFQEDPAGYFRADAWFEQCQALMVIGDKTAEPSPPQVLQDTLEWAIKLARLPEFERYTASGAKVERPLLSGLAAYDEFAEALERDEDFPADDREVLAFRLMPVFNDGIYLMDCKRNAAARFLKDVADWALAGTDELWEAADAYTQEAEVWHEAVLMAPHTWAAEENPWKMADPALRRELARLVREAKVHEERAVEHLEQAHQMLIDESV